MKLVNYIAGKETCLGIKLEQGILDVKKAAATSLLHLPLTMDEVIKRGAKALEALSTLTESPQFLVPEKDISYAPCVLQPEKILCVGLNYMSHRDECKLETPPYPVIFSKFNNTLAAHQESIPLPASAQKFDYEAELVIIIGKEAANVSKEAALSYVFGYTAGNDLSARDLQMRTGQWLLGKTCDHFAPIGPCIVTADEINPYNLDIECRVNGEVRQSANTKDMIFDCATIVSYLSQHMTLKPGDIIFSGTPGGVILGYPENEQMWLKAGDQVTVTIEKIGSLINVLK